MLSELFSELQYSTAPLGADVHLAPDRGALKVVLSDLPGESVIAPVDALTLVAEWHNRREIVWEPDRKSVV